MKKTLPYGSRKFLTIDQYHASFSKDIQNKLQQLRKIITQVVSQATETISYNIPTFKLNKNLVHYAAYKEHIGFYPTPSPLIVFKDELVNYKTSKGAIQFPIDKPLPITLIKKIVKYRVSEDILNFKVNKNPTYKNTITFFSTQVEFRNWLKKHHKKESELLVGFYKVNSEKPSMTWSQSVDQALCFGWIDGIRKSINNESYCIRFTPRKAGSIWSAVNIKKVDELIQKKLMQPTGLAIFEKRTEAKSKIYTHENSEIPFSAEFEKLFKSNKKGWDYFQSLASSYRKLSTNWVMTAKQETTKLKRLNELITHSEALTNKWKDNKYNKK